ncbi:neuronal acetylcholine receptor subunit alpha-7 isoform X2 [Nematostella vectensis]|uniref:neuronal acetylcholine receptor subunit alpha-7 isoform X2 n=1 Tax=Nematostella vectensis TaxID=45351 RepID=UPI0020775AF5|nr:neuronal acetylcholine receptor subunit alpha-7 isoform X2 [Nematostella vectensis]
MALRLAPTLGLIFKIFIQGLLIWKGFAIDTKRTEVVQKLEMDLFRTYNKDVLPKETLDKGVPVRLDLALNQIIDVYWRDPRLRWNVSAYDGVDNIVIKASRLWLPDITLYNNARDDYKLDKESQHSLTITSRGGVSRFFPTIYKSSCALNIRHFPFDDQTCILKLGSWSYNVFEVNLTNVGNGDLNSFISNGEWVLKGMPAERHETKFRCCPHPYIFLLYKINIRRRSLYYVINCFTPCLIMLALTFLGFYLPSGSGERMGMGITVLLSLSIIQLMLSDSLPPNEEIPLIVRYYGLTMFNIFLSLVYTCLVLMLYHTDSYPLPNWMKVLLCDYGAWLVRLTEEWRKIQEKRRNLEEDTKYIYRTNSLDKYPPALWLPCGDIPTGSIAESGASRSPPRVSPSGTSAKFEKFILNQYREEDRKELLKEEWKFASKVLNSLFKWSMVASIIINFFIAFIGAPVENLTDWVPK